MSQADLAPGLYQRVGVCLIFFIFEKQAALFSAQTFCSHINEMLRGFKAFDPS